MADKTKEIRERLKEKMYVDEVIPLENDEEYYYAVGQLSSYFVSVDKCKVHDRNFIKKIMAAKSDEELKKILVQTYKKYNDKMPFDDVLSKNLLALVFGYKPETGVDEDLVLIGFLDNCLVYKKIKL